MPKPRKKAAKNADSIVVPKGSMLVGNASGFPVKNQQTTIAEVSWDQVQAIFAYTRICDGLARLSLQFFLPDDNEGNEHSLMIDDSVEGWERLKASLSEAFPTLNKEWENMAAFEEASELADLAPKYVANVNEVWRRDRET
jgi:hypothetical protein